MRRVLKSLLPNLAVVCVLALTSGSVNAQNNNRQLQLPPNNSDLARQTIVRMVAEPLKLSL